MLNPTLQRKARARQRALKLLEKYKSRKHKSEPLFPPRSPSPKSQRRHSLPSRYDTCLRLTRLKRFPSSEKKKIYRTTSDTIRSPKDYLKEIQHHRREGLKHAPYQQQLVTPQYQLQPQKEPAPRKLSKHEKRVLADVHVFDDTLATAVSKLPESSKAERKLNRSSQQRYFESSSNDELLSENCVRLRPDKTADVHVFDNTLATAVNKLPESSKAERKFNRSISQQRFFESSSNDELLSENFHRLRPDKPETRVKKDQQERGRSRRREERETWIQDPPYQGDPESLFVRRQSQRLPTIENLNIRRSKSVKDTCWHKKDSRSSARTFLDPSPVSEVGRWIQPQGISPVQDINWYSGPSTPPRPYRTGYRKRVESPHRVQVEHQKILPCSSYDEQEGAAAAALPARAPPLPRRNRSRKNSVLRFNSISTITSHSTDLDFTDRMKSLEEHERKIIIEFCHLLEKSKQLFNGLRELPQYGHKQWHSYFGRTFDVYTKLWKFQQQHRTILDNKYGLKRWQIGEIASKIGQLYYHFYLRTSETAYLNEAYSFYYAIRGRSYYTKASKEDKCELMVKKLRYYARFIVVCLLLKKLNLVSELIRELDKQIVEYGNAYDPEDQAEWTVVVNEVKAFIKAEPVVSVVHPDNYSVILSHRLTHQSTPPVDRLSQMVLTLQEVLIVGSNSTQVKFSELTMDMFRMMQTLEREPTGDIQHMFEDSPQQQFVPAAVNNTGYNIDCTMKYGDNPHKYLLFKPSPSQIFVYLASGCNDLPPNGVILLYMSAEGLIVPPSRHPEEAAAGGFDVGGLITTSRSDITYRETTKDGKPVPPKHREQQVLHPGDLFAFTRRPMFLIIDSDNSYIFQSMPRHFGQPLVILMSPVEIPTCMHMATIEKRAEGSLFTLFLHSPLTALCFCCDVRRISLNQWERAQSYIDCFLVEALQVLIRTRPDSMYVAFMGDDFLRLLTMRFIFCETVMRLHRAFRSRNHLTRSSPPIPDEIFDHQALTQIVLELAVHLQIRAHFHEPAGAVGPAPNRE